MRVSALLRTAVPAVPAVPAAQNARAGRRRGGAGARGRGPRPAGSVLHSSLCPAGAHGAGGRSGRSAGLRAAASAPCLCACRMRVPARLPCVFPTARRIWAAGTRKRAPFRWSIPGGSPRGRHRGCGSTADKSRRAPGVAQCCWLPRRTCLALSVLLPRAGDASAQLGAHGRPWLGRGPSAGEAQSGAGMCSAAPRAVRTDIFGRGRGRSDAVGGSALPDHRRQAADGCFMAGVI
jgi:hypothetical protein